MAQRDTTVNLRAIAENFATVSVNLNHLTPQLSNILDVSKKSLAIATRFMEMSHQTASRNGSSMPYNPESGSSLRQHEAGPSSRQHENGHSYDYQREAGTHRQREAETTRRPEVTFEPCFSSTLLPTPRAMSFGSRGFQDPQLDMPRIDMSTLGNSSLNGNYAKVNIKRDYVLTTKYSFDLWYDKLLSELTSAGLLYVINQSAPGPSGLDESTRSHNSSVVRDIIVSRIEGAKYSQSS